MKCRVCDNESNNREYTVREMFYGTRDEFRYVQCGACDCLQIAEFPENIENYFPAAYYSFRAPAPYFSSRTKKFLRSRRDNYLLFRQGVTGKLISMFYPFELLEIISEASISRESRILDVGCGSGKLLLILKANGCRNLTGIDPFLDEDIHYEGGLSIYKKVIGELEEKQDLIMFHHSFEHIPNPLETLKSVSALLNPGGYCIIRVPTVSSYAWEHYRENWVQLDAPRHFFLHSRASMDILAKEASLAVEKVIYDASEFQFTGSERYVRDIPLADKTLDTEILSEKEIKDFKKQARKLNREMQGDSCAFILKKQPG